MRREDVKLPPDFGKINGMDHPDTTIAKLTERLRFAELSLNIWDEGRNSEYWLRYPTPISNGERHSG